MMVLFNSVLKLTFTDTLHISTLGADLISLSILQYKNASVWSWENSLIISKNSDNLFLAVLSC